MMGIEKAATKHLVTFAAGLVTKIFRHRVVVTITGFPLILPDMRSAGLFKNVVVRTALGLAALLLFHWLVDYVNLQTRHGYLKITPYVFVILMYGWMVFHNRILFDKLFLRNRKAAYLAWTGLAMFMFSINMYYIITTSFSYANPLPQIISFWMYTFAGLGVYVLWKTLISQAPIPEPLEPIPGKNPNEQIPLTTTFTYTQDGQTHDLPLDSIYYFESLENYVRIITARKPIVVRLTLKDAEAKLPRPPFLRISRSHIANMKLVDSNTGDLINIGVHQLKVGKVYKKYVESYSR